MPGRFPTAEDVSLPNISGSRPAASIDVSGYGQGAQALARAGQKLGADIQQSASDIVQANVEQQRQQVENAKVGLATDYIGLRQKYQNDTGPDVEQRWNEDARNAQQKYLQGMSPGPLRTHFEAVSGEMLAHEGLQSSQHAFKLAGEFGLANAKSTLDTLIKNSKYDPTEAADPTINAAIQGYTNQIDQLARQGHVSFDHAETLKEAGKRAYAARNLDLWIQADPEGYLEARGAWIPQAKINKAVAGSAINAWRSQGMSDNGIAGVLHNINQESGFDSSLRQADQPNWGGEAHFAHGLYQEGGTEWNRYQEWLRQTHQTTDWRDPNLQNEFAAWNLKTNYPKVWARMNAARTPEEAASIYMTDYLKPSDDNVRYRLRLNQRGVPPLSNYGVTGALPAQGPQAIVFHHTGGGDNVSDIEQTFRRRGVGAEYVIDRDGKIHQTGAAGANHMKAGWGIGAGLNNNNTIGVEVIADNDADVNPAQVAAAKSLMQRYPNTPVYGHGQVNPGHKEPDEGMTIVNAINGSRNQGATARSTVAAYPRQAYAQPSDFARQAAGGEFDEPPGNVVAQAVGATHAAQAAQAAQAQPAQQSQGGVLQASRARPDHPLFSMVDPMDLMRHDTAARALIQQQAQDQIRLNAQRVQDRVDFYTRNFQDVADGVGALVPREMIRDDPDLNETKRNEMLAHRSAEEKRLGAEAEGAAYNALERGQIYEKAGLGPPVPLEAIEQNPSLTDPHRNTLLRTWVEMHKQDEAYQQTLTKFYNPDGGAFNPYDTEEKKQVDKIYRNLRNLGGDAQAMNLVVDRTGTIPNAMAVQLRGSLVSNNADSVLTAAQMSRNLLARNPTIFAGVEGGKELQDAGVAYQHYTESLGMTPAQAAAKIMEMDSPKYKDEVLAKIKGENVGEIIKKQLSPDDIRKAFNEHWIGGRPNLEFTEGAKTQAFQDYAELFKDKYLETGDVGVAKAQAVEQLKKIWGVSFLTGTRGGVLMKFPPERAPAYANIPDVADRIADDAIDAIYHAPEGPWVGATGARDITRDRVVLMPTPGGQTATAYMAGQPVPYLLGWRDKSDVLHMLNPGKAYVFDPSQVSEDRRTKLEAAIAERDRQQAAIAGAGEELAKRGVPVNEAVLPPNDIANQLRALDTQEYALNRSGLGGVFRNSQLARIAKRRAELQAQIPASAPDQAAQAAGGALAGEAP